MDIEDKIIGREQTKNLGVLRSERPLYGITETTQDCDSHS